MPLIPAQLSLPPMDGSTVSAEDDEITANAELVAADG